MTYDLAAWNNSIAGDVAFDLFVSGAAFPLVDWMNAHKAEYNTAFLIAVVECYAGMVATCYDGRYNGVRRKLTH
jgi:hypothetical protein